MNKRRLTPKQKAFADHYIELGNATQAAIKAGYSKKTAAVIATENLTKPNIKAYIDEKMEEISSKRIMGAVEAMELLTSIARAEEVEEVVLATESGVKKVKKIPDIRDRQRAAEELLKRYAVSQSDKLQEDMLKARIDKTKAETDRINREVDTGETENIVIVNEWGYTDEN